MSASVVVDFASTPEFPNTPDGDTPKVEIVRGQVRTFIEGFVAVKRRLPDRIALDAADHRHCCRRILTRMQRPVREQAKAEWRERRKAGSKELCAIAAPSP